jgi:hypothetical protein
MNRLHYFWANHAPLWAARRYWRGKDSDMLWHFIIGARESVERIVELETGHQIRAARAAVRRKYGLLAFPIFWFFAVFRGRPSAARPAPIAPGGSRVGKPLQTTDDPQGEDDK